MPDRPRETHLICHEAEAADESATRVHRLLILSMVDGIIGDDEYTEILSSVTATLGHTGQVATRIATYDHIVEEVNSLLHNGRSPRARRLAAARRLREERAEYEVH